MKTINFEFNGPQSMVIPDDHLSLDCAQNIITGRSYPLPTWERVPKVIVDIGGHAGEFSVIARCRWGKGPRIYCFEPNPELMPYLIANAEQYGFLIKEQAVGLGHDVQELRVSGYGSVANSLVERPNQTGETRSVNVIHPRIIAGLYPDILKIDCEGVEVEVLAGMGIGLAKIQMIYVEFHRCPDRLAIEQLLGSTHDLWAARIAHREQGELFYAQKSILSGVPV